jgi:carbonic anhydrase
MNALCAAVAVALAVPSVTVARETPAAGAAPSAAHAGASHAAQAGAGHAVSAAANPDAVWTELLAGNQRFRDGKTRQHRMSRAQFAELAKGQHPKAVVLTCSDSRVPPELVFDQGVGDVFVVRLAGNVAAKAAIGSIEYAAEHLGSSLLVVLGHSKCGAVGAAAASAGKIDAGSNLGCILADIAPAVDTARHAGAKDEVDVAIHENAKLVAASLLEKSEILRHLVHEEKLKVVTAVYDLRSGAVTEEPHTVATLH